MLIMARAQASVELAAGDLGAAEHELHVALDLGRDAGLREAVAQTAARLSLLAVQRDPVEAELLASLSRDNTPKERVAAQALWQAATARVTASRNAHGEAERSRGRRSVWCRPRCPTSGLISWLIWPGFCWRAETKPARRQ